MIESAKGYVTGYEFISMLALFTYWIPLTICLVVYFFRFIEAYKDDLSRCENKYYTPTLTVGKVAWYLGISITPCINIFATVFDCGSSIFKWLGKTLNFPLVRKRPVKTEVKQ